MKNSILLRRFIVTAFAVALLSSMAWGDGRIARFKQGLFLYSNWDAPHVTIDTCLDMTITELHIPNAVEHNGRSYPVIEIGHGAFHGCHNLVKVFFNELSVNILRDAFKDCPCLQVLVIPFSTPPKMKTNHPFYSGGFEDIFEPYHAESVIVVVPPGSEEVYRNTFGWSNFRNIQSTMPTDDQLDQGVIKARIGHLELQIQQAREQANRLERELEVLRQLEQSGKK